MKFKYLFLIGFLVMLSQDAFTQGIGPNNWRTFASIARYDKANLELKLHMKAENRVVFMGNSITEGWIQMRSDFFKDRDYINRGIGGQTTHQMLLRFLLLFLLLF